MSTALQPDGWRDRVVPFVEPASALCLEPYDLVISKLAAMREKDRIFATELVRAGLVSLETLGVGTLEWTMNHLRMRTGAGKTPAGSSQ